MLPAKHGFTEPSLYRIRHCIISHDPVHKLSRVSLMSKGAITFSIHTWCVQVLRSPKEAFAAAMQSWRERCEKCLCLQGDYVEKLLHFQLPVVSSFLKIN